MTTTPEKVSRAAQVLAESVNDLKNSESYKAALEFRTKFHSYSFANCWLIYNQCPTATLVAGYKKWQEMGRQVKKGETSIAIFAPLIRKEKNKNGEEEKRAFNFRTVGVFDVSQTEGEDLPELHRPKLLEGDSLQTQIMIGGAKLYAKSQGISIVSQNLENIMSSYDPKTNKIILSSTLPPLHTLKSLVHQLAHALKAGTSFGEDKKLEDKLEAEATAYLTLQEFGLDTSEYTFPLLANWTDDPMELLKIGERGYQASRALVAQLKKFLPRPASELAHAA
jgi:antirestriction protein ArdC